MTQTPLAPDGHWTLDLPTRRATRRLAQRLGAHLQVGDLVVLAGPLGAGKTFFVRALARRLGLTSSEPVTSPTFALMQELPTPAVALVHADLYRLTSPDEALELGLRAARDSNCLVVEWGQPFIGVLGGDALVIEFTRAPRRALVESTGPRSGELLGHLHAGFAADGNAGLPSRRA